MKDKDGVISSGPMKGRKKCDKCRAYYIPNKEHECIAWMVALIKMKQKSK